MTLRHALLAACLLLLLDTASRAEIKIESARGGGTSGFRFENVPAPTNNDAATSARFSLVDGQRDSNGGELEVLHNGRLPTEEDQPAENFFFRAGTNGGRIQIDLGQAISIKQIGSFSWHVNTRAAQVYKLYGANGNANGFVAAPKTGMDPATCGWKLLANVDTRPAGDNVGGQYGVVITDSSGALGSFRYLLFDIATTESLDPFGNTFYSEIDVIDAQGPAPVAIVTAPTKPILKSFAAVDGKYHFTIDATAAADLEEWSEKELQPVVQEWYPRIVAMLPSEGFEPPTNVTLRFRGDMRGTPASAGGSGINLNAVWFRRELKREALGSVVHEMVHVVQSYHRAAGPTRRGGPKGKSARNPGWLVEGIADYIRWFVYEPETQGAQITKRNFSDARYDSSYRITANFLDWVTHHKDQDIVRKLNAAAREGQYDEPLWKDWTGKSVQELGVEWKSFHEQRINASTRNKE